MNGNVAMEHSPQGGDRRSVVLLFDGVCRFCNGAVRFILAHDRAGTMRFATLQGEFAREVLARHPRLRGLDSIVLVESGATPDDERIVVQLDATLDIAEYLGGVWRAARILRALPRPVRDWSYGLFARVRYRLFGRYDSCPLPDAAVRERFLP